ncbi:MAG: C25 family cysteine peptidase [Bacteroidia bacterium]
MIRRLLVSCCMLLTVTVVRAQYGNEWINYSQNYYKIKIAQDGIYRIDSAALASSGIPLSTINPKNFQLFCKGKQQFIYIQGESDNVFNSGDFIEFYGQKNDGSLDSLLYFNTSFIPNPYYSQINDTAVYFLTWNSSTSNNRMQQDNDFSYSSYLPDNYFIKDEIQEFHDGYYEGETDGVGGTDSRYTKAEGWFYSSVINLGGSLTFYAQTAKQFAGGPNAIVKTVALGASKSSAIPVNDHELKIECSGNLLVDTLFTGYEANRFTYSIPLSMLGPVNTPFTFTSINPGTFTSNRTAISYVDVRYPHTFDLEGKTGFLMYIPLNGFQSKSYLQITNLTASGAIHLYDLTNAKRIDVNSGTFDSVLVSNGLLVPAEKKCYITSDGYINNIASLQPVTPSAQFTDFSTMAVDSAYLIITHKSLMSAALSYKSYRSSAAGGFHNVVLVDIDDLYDQFAYGIVKSPLSIRGFCNYALHTFPTPPKNLFIIGKAYHMQYARQDPSLMAGDLVPSFGNPSSDNLLTSGLSGGIHPAIPTGRLAAQNTTHADIYLNKVQEYESNAPAEWMKHVLHFGGGTTSGEQDDFKAYLNNYKTIIEDTLYGGQVSSFFKTSSAPIEINTSDTLRDFMNEGVSLMTFFGHAAASGFDQSIDDINSYNPLPGHYPFMLANGCYSGDIHSTEWSTSENYVINDEKGMIGYLASVGLGVPYALNEFSRRFYEELSVRNYGGTVGSCLQHAIDSIEVAAMADPIRMSVCNEMTLHGDPALVINAHQKPDYKITNNDVYFDLTQVTDSIRMYVVRTNLGRATNDTIFTQALRTFPDGTTQTYLSFTPAPKFKDTILIKIPWNFSKDIGLNKMRVTLDYFNRVDELNEANNVTSPDINFIINGGDVVPVYPYEFAIIPKDTITLKASTADFFAPVKNYIFQIDTTDAFLSPLGSGIVSSPGGVISWKPSFTFSDSTVYYWRVSPDSTVAGDVYKWRESSFQYIAGKRGWEQAHFFQFKNDDYQYVKFNRPARKFDFVNDIKNLQCNNGIYPYMNWIDIGYKINGAAKYVWSFTVPGFTIAVFNPVSADNWQSVASGPPLNESQYGSVTFDPVGRIDNAFDWYQNDSTNRAKITNFINTVIPVGYKVLVWSQSYHSIPSWENSLYTAFESLGSGSIRTVPASVPYILYGTKGAAIGTARELVGDTVNSLLHLDTTIVSNWDEGSISSPVIGPAVSWDSLSWRDHTLDGGVTHDSIVVRMIGIKADGTESTLANFDVNNQNIPNLSTFANASIYPKIRLVAYMRDDSLNTPPQLDKWQVFYSPVPEAAINPPMGYYAKDSVEEGDNIIVHLPVQNISEFTFPDSLLFTYWLEDANRVYHPLPSKLKKDLFVPSEVLIDTIHVNTSSYPGSNALWVEVNPLHPMDTLDQPKIQLEQYHFNNIVRIPFYVSTDRINPLLDVTFDGIHIMNSDIISAKPNILIQLKDENQFLALNDTNDFKVFIQAPGSSVAQRVYFGSNMSFTPAVLPNNSCRINYTPLYSQDGAYQMIVQAKDQSDNQSGAIDYKISFEVINKATITEVMNYPNPFSSATHFVFTLTGSEVPTYFKIQVMTITGKVVREITNDELGNIHIGRNITDYAWDGKDEFGDQLANGVYLYRVITTLHGDNIEKRDSGADPYFKKGFGKMYLMR